MKASIIILNWNGLEHLQDCLYSLFNQSYKDFEVIFVDNNSLDNSIEFVKKNFPECKLILNKENTGQTGGDEIGTKHAKGEYIIWLDNDTKVDKNWLKEIVKIADENKDVGMVACKMLFFTNPKLINSTGLLAFTDGSAIDRGFKEEDRGQYDKVDEVFGPCGGAALYKKEMLDDIYANNEYYDQGYFAYYEDLDIAYRARLRNWKCLYTPKAVVYHKINATARKISNLGLTCSIKNKMFNLIKNYPPKLWMKYGPFIIARQIVSISYHLIRFNKHALKARFEMIIKIPHYLKKRREIQKKRLISTKGFEKLLIKRSFLDYLFFHYD